MVSTEIMLELWLEQELKLKLLHVVRMLNLVLGQYKV